MPIKQQPIYMSTLNTDEIWACFENIDTYYVGDKDDNDEVSIWTELSVRVIRRDGVWKYVGKFSISGEGGLAASIDTKEYDHPDDVVKELGGHLDGKGFINGSSFETQMKFKLGPEVENFQDWPE